MNEIIRASDPKFKLSVHEMDNTHAEFIALVNLLALASNAEFIGLFDKLVEHTERHFLQEDNLMLLSGFPAHDEHAAEHNRVLRDLRQIQQRVQMGRIALARAWVKEQAPQWFELHIQTMDSALAQHLENSMVDLAST